MVRVSGKDALLTTKGLVHTLAAHLSATLDRCFVSLSSLD
jgi:hypothetical protein